MYLLNIDEAFGTIISLSTNKCGHIFQTIFPRPNLNLPKQHNASQYTPLIVSPMARDAESRHRSVAKPSLPSAKPREYLREDEVDGWSTARTFLRFPSASGGGGNLIWKLPAPWLRRGESAGSSVFPSRRCETLRCNVSYRRHACPFPSPSPRRDHCYSRLHRKLDYDVLY